MRLRGMAARRNVLLVVLESTGRTLLAPFGAAEDPMADLSALASHAIVFENAYAVYPEQYQGIRFHFASRYPGFDVRVERLRRRCHAIHSNSACSDGYATALFHLGRFHVYLGMERLVARSGFALTEDAGAIGG